MSIVCINCIEEPQEILVLFLIEFLHFVTLECTQSGFEENTLCSEENACHVALKHEMSYELIFVFPVDFCITENLSDLSPFLFDYDERGGPSLLI